MNGGRVLIRISIVLFTTTCTTSVAAQHKPSKGKESSTVKGSEPTTAKQKAEPSTAKKWRHQIL